MTITTVGIDLAKNVFAVHCIDQNGKAVLVKPKVSRAALSELIAGSSPHVFLMACTISTGKRYLFSKEPPYSSVRKN